MNNKQGPTPRPGRTKRRIFRILKILVLLYASIGIALYYLQEKFLFHPTPLPQEHKFAFSYPYEEFNIPYTKKENLSIIHFLAKDTVARGAVLYFHGNRDNVERYAKFTETFTSNGYEVWMVDYPGYGKTTGELTERKLYDQASQVYKLANGKFNKDSIIIYGKSLGTGIATQLASMNPAKMLILETPYYSIPDLFGAYAPIYPTSRMSTFKLPLAEYLDKCKMPVMIFHGTDDEVIPFRSAKKLRSHLKSSDQFIVIEDGEHNNLTEYPVYKEKMDSVLR